MAENAGYHLISAPYAACRPTACRPMPLPITNPNNECLVEKNKINLHTSTCNSNFATSVALESLDLK